ncbi:MAG: HAD family phosphatase [Coprococcus catus]|nr:HAD family phosphatase [Coprococcus catus]
MIKNIVFDMGNVLVAYDGRKVCKHYIKDKKDRKRVFTAIFQSPEWVYLDMGMIPEEQAVDQMCARLPKRLHEAARLCMRDWHLYNMKPIKAMIPVIQDLKARGFKLYICSNASLRLPMCYQELLPEVDSFDGILFSAEEKLLKPQKEIYERLFEKFNIKPEECYFIDDLQLNIDGAAACGMKGYCFADGNVEKLQKALDKLNEDTK